jgi:D-lactate dehydrogenase (cytochrome)
VEAVRARLAPLLGDRLSAAAAVREHHGRGESLHRAYPPDLVAWPQSTEEVAEIVTACAAHGVPVIPFGAGSSLEGQVEAREGGVCIDMTRMDRVLSVNQGDFDCRVEAGVTRERLNEELRAEGLFFPLDPGANATLGGMAATRASGTNAVRYGTMRDVVMGLTVVTPSGEVIRTGTRARKSSAGYDLTRLYVGSEGTLGVITELALKLSPIPEEIASGVVQFERLGQATEAVTGILQMGVPIARMELMDALQVRACVAYSGLVGLEEKPTLFLEFHGSPSSVREQVATAGEVIEAAGGGQFDWATDHEARGRLWKARHEAWHAGRALAPGHQSLATDACVPITRLAEVIEETIDEAGETGLLCPIVGHVGDGNFHVMILYDADDAAEAERAQALADSVARRAIAAGGTCTGEHGVGVHKLGVVGEELGASVHVMHAIKAALDPQGIMNPGKTLPPAPGGVAA